MAAQLAAEALGARRVVAKINDPVRAEAYAHLGIASLCRTEPDDRRRPRLSLGQAAAGAARASTRRSTRTVHVARGPAPSSAARPRAPLGARPPVGPDVRPTGTRARRPAPPARRAERCSCWSSAAARSATT